MAAARHLLEWNGVLPNLRIVEEEEHGETATFMVVADYGWTERILCGGCYQQDAEAILAGLDEAIFGRPLRREAHGLLWCSECGHAIGTLERGEELHPPTDALYMNAEPSSFTEALLWLRMIVSEVPHGKSHHRIGVELARAQDLVGWLSARFDKAKEEALLSMLADDEEER